MKKLITGAIIGVGMLASAASFAAPIYGSIVVNGTVILENNSGTQVAPNQATYLDFSPNNAGTTGTAITGSATQDLLPFDSAVATVKDFNFATFAPITAWLTVTDGGALTLTFDLATVSVVGTPTATDLTLRGTGFFNITGGGSFTQTAADWEFTTTTGPNGSSVGTFSYTTTLVPAPAPIALLGLALLGMGVARKRAIFG